MNLLSNFRRFRRQDFALIFVGSAFASFGYHLYLWFRFMGTQPRVPDPATGLIYPMNNHGWYYYLSAMQATELGMLMYLSFILFLIGAVIYGRRPVKQPWEKYRMPDKGSGIFFVISLLLSILVLWFSGYSLASFLVSKGLFLEPGNSSRDRPQHKGPPPGDPRFKSWKLEAKS